MRLIGDTPTREMSVFEGMRLLRGAPGTKISLTIIRGNANDPHVVELTREAPPAVDVTSRIISPGIGYLRVAAVSARTAEQAKAKVGELTRGGATKLIVDVRRASGGSGTGAYSYAVTSAGTAGCSISAGALNSTSPGTCTVTVTRASSTNYLSASSSATTVTKVRSAARYPSRSWGMASTPTALIGPTASRASPRRGRSRAS